MTNRRNGTLYIGVTNNLARRVHEHREALVDGFTRRYGLKRLVWAEADDGPLAAIRREKAPKRWNRAWKLALIDRDNPHWRDLFADINR